MKTLLHPRGDWHLSTETMFSFGQPSHCLVRCFTEKRNRVSSDSEIQRTKGISEDTCLYIFTDFYTLLQDIRRKDGDDTLKRGEKDK